MVGAGKAGGHHEDPLIGSSPAGALTASAILHCVKQGTRIT